jgi:tetratricopeptide (TPR) repeat protein
MDHGQCLTEGTFVEYLEGGLDPAIKAASEVHLVACDDCRRRLGFFMRLLDEDVNPTEGRELQLIDAKWRKRHGGKLPQRSRSYRAWALVGGVVASLFGGVFIMQVVVNPPNGADSATEVVQLLLSQSRPFEARMSDQPYLPLVRTRGLNEPGVAFGLLGREMTRLSANGHEMGRFYLLQKDFDRAINYLTMAEQEAGTPAGVHNDLGVAYLESAGEGRADRAAGEFRHALELDPSYAPALFNLAVAHERLGSAPEAEKYWQKFLEMETDMSWAQEARSRLGAMTYREGLKGQAR